MIIRVEILQKDFKAPSLKHKLLRRLEGIAYIETKEAVIFSCQNENEKKSVELAIGGM